MPIFKVKVFYHSHSRWILRKDDYNLLIFLNTKRTIDYIDFYHSVKVELKGSTPYFFFLFATMIQGWQKCCKLRFEISKNVDNENNNDLLIFFNLQGFQINRIYWQFNQSNWLFPNTFLMIWYFLIHWVDLTYFVLDCSKLKDESLFWQ